MAFLHGSVNSFRDQDIRRALRPLTELAEQTGATIVVVRHLNKTAGGNVLYRGGGSIGIIGAARLGMVVGVDPDDDTRRVLAVAKSNLATIPPSLAYQLVAADEHGCARIVWQGTSAHTADVLLAIPANEEDRTAHDEAVDFLRSFLAPGAQQAGDVLRAAKSAGLAERTVQRARKRAGIRTSREGFGRDGKWWWSLELTGIGDVEASIDAIDASPPATDTLTPMASMDGCSSPMALHDLPLTALGVCRLCRATTATGNDLGSLCAACAIECRAQP